MNAARPSTVRHRSHKRQRRTMTQIIIDVERVNGAAAPTEVLMVCKHTRALERTVEAQRNLIRELSRKNAELRKGESK